MLRNRPRTVPTLMADHYSHSSQSPNTKPISSFFVSLRFRAFTTKGLSEADSLMSPTSTLDSKLFLSPNPNLNSNPNPKTKNLLLIENTQIKKHPKTPESEPRGIGLALINSFSEEDQFGGNGSKPRNGKVLFGSKLRVQIPKSSIFGPTRSNQVPSPTPPQAFTLEEMELSEDYTCVTSHGPNPRTTHIFDNRVLETHSSIFSGKSVSSSPNKTKNFTSFLSSCHTCSKNLEQKIDIFIYRGEKAFCSEDCRSQEMILDGVENSGF